MSKAHLFLFVAGSGALLACGSGDTGDTDPSGGKGGAGGESSGAAMNGGGGGSTSSNGDGGSENTLPTVSFEVTPLEVDAGDVVTAKVTVENFVLEEPIGQPNAPYTGHYHIYIDDDSEYLVAEQHTTVEVEIPAETTPGKHILRIALGTNTHAPLVPPVEDTVELTVR